MPKRRRYGSYYHVDKKTGKGYVRVQIPTGERDGQGKLKYKIIKRRAKNQTHAEELAAEILEEYKSQGAGFLRGREMTFADAVSWYVSEFVIEPVYTDGRLVAGMRGFKYVRRKLAKLAEEFGSLKISEVNEDVLRRFKIKRLKEDRVAIATLNRDLEFIRTILRKLYKRKLLRELPDFTELIVSGERVRNVVLDAETESKLLESAKTLKNPEIYYLIIALHDTGARPSELFAFRARYDETLFEPVTWQKFFDGRGEALEIVSYKGRERKPRVVPVSARLAAALDEYWQWLISTGHNPQTSDAIFGQSTYERAWAKVKEKAGLKDLDLRLRDLRRSFRTRLEKAGYSPLFAAKILGHTTAQSFHYTALDAESILMAKNLLDNSQIQIDSKTIN